MESLKDDIRLPPEAGDDGFTGKNELKQVLCGFLFYHAAGEMQEGIHIARNFGGGKVNCSRIAQDVVEKKQATAYDKRK